MAAQLSYFNFQTYKANAFKFLFCELYGCRLIELPQNDRDRISPYNINTISSRQVMRIEENIS